MSREHAAPLKLGANCALCDTDAAAAARTPADADDIGRPLRPLCLLDLADRAESPTADPSRGDPKPASR